MAQRVDSRAMKRARVLPSWVLQWLLNLFPAFLLGGAWVSRVARDCSACRLSVRRSLLTRNLNGTIFGGSLYSACDPIYALLYWQSLARRGVGLLAPGRCSADLNCTKTPAARDHALATRAPALTAWAWLAMISKEMIVMAVYSYGPI